MLFELMYGPAKARVAGIFDNFHIAASVAEGGLKAANEWGAIIINYDCWKLVVRFTCSCFAIPATSMYMYEGAMGILPLSARRQ